MLTINSYGIACVRKREEYEVLMIKRKCTYAFIQYVRGIYKSNFEVQNLLSKMTIIEKNIIYYGTFDIAYFHAFTRCRAQIKTKAELKNYERLEKIYNSFAGERLEKVLACSRYGLIQWEFPKGRKQESENDLESAMREFEEETGIVKYNILRKTKPFNMTVRDAGVEYKYMIYVAIGDEEPLYDVNFANIEISEIAWIPSSTANYCLSGETLNVFKTIIKVVKKQTDLIYVTKTEIERNCGECTVEEGL